MEQAISAFLHRGSYVLWLCISSFALGYGGIWAALLAGVTAIEFSYVELPVGFDPGACNQSIAVLSAPSLLC